MNQKEIIIIIIIVFIFHLSNFGYIPRDVEIVKYSHIKEHKMWYNTIR